MSDAEKPVVFACAGCSFAGRLAYDLAMELNRQEIAEMSCLAGLAAMKQPFLRKVEGRSVWIVDGCPIECSLGVLRGLGMQPDAHIRLHELGFNKMTPPEVGIDFRWLVKRVLEDASDAMALPAARSV